MVVLHYYTTTSTYYYVCMYVLIQSMYCFSWLAAYWLVWEDPPKGVFPRRFFTSCTQNNAIKMKVLIMRVMKKPSWAALLCGACIGTYIHRGPSMWNSFLNRTVPRNNLMSIWPNQFEMHLLEKTTYLGLQPHEDFEKYLKKCFTNKK